MPLPITPPRLDLADRKRGLRAVERLIDRLKREGLGLTAIQTLLRAGRQYPAPLGYKDMEPEWRHSWTKIGNRLQASGLAIFKAGLTAGQRSSITLTPRAQRILGL